MGSAFLDVLRSGHVIIFDGGMGTELDARGAAAGAAASLSSPAVVRAVHMDYRQAGADVLITNTFGANRIALAKSGQESQLLRIIEAACALAREALGDGGWLAGDIGPTGEFLEPYGTLTQREMREAFLETARALAQCGVDLFIIETMSDAREMALAVEACREAAAGLPVIASMAFNAVRSGFRTNTGLAPTEAARAMSAAGADVIGTNCGGVTPEQMAQVVGELRAASDRPIIAQANAGLPELIEGKAVFRLSPEAFASGMMTVHSAGAQLLGGCCGTTPAHIRALKNAMME